MTQNDLFRSVARRSECKRVSISLLLLSPPLPDNAGPVGRVGVCVCVLDLDRERTHCFFGRAAMLPDSYGHTVYRPPGALISHRPSTIAACEACGP
jgi:hypothetical protein